MAGHELSVGGPVAATNGSEVSVALRPEAMGLATGADLGNQMSGRIADVTFLGSIVRIRVRLADGNGMVAFDTFNNPHVAPPAIDSQVTLAFPPEAVLVLAASETPATAVIDDDGLPAI